MASNEAPHAVHQRKTNPKVIAKFEGIKTGKNEVKQKLRADQLTPKQKAFIKFVASGESGTNAALKAGVSVNSAQTLAVRWRKHPIVQQMIADEQKKYAITCQMTKEKVMDMHMEAYNMSKLMSEPATMVSAAREIGKLCGYYEPMKYQVDINVSGQVALERLNTLSDAELLKLIAEGAPKGSVGALLPPPQASQTAN